jgi:hypothetical protein
MSWSLSSLARAAVRALPAVGVAVTALLCPVVAPATSRGSSGKCRIQAPQRFLKRSSYVKNGMLLARQHERALRYRVEQYGHVPGLGLERYNPIPVSEQVALTHFFGKPVTMHRKVIPALACVEKRIRSVCTKAQDRYLPKHVGGLRTENTIRGGELSNHLFGIAIDFDPNDNPCCHCVKKWQGNPRCQIEGKSPFLRAEVTRCWVDAFERYGFYWLGYDKLEDTMHFEFLGEPPKMD